MQVTFILYYKEYKMSWHEITHSVQIKILQYDIFLNDFLSKLTRSYGKLPFQQNGSL